MWLCREVASVSSVRGKQSFASGNVQSWQALQNFRRRSWPSPGAFLRQVRRLEGSVAVPA